MSPLARAVILRSLRRQRSDVTTCAAREREVLLRPLPAGEPQRFVAGVGLGLAEPTAFGSAGPYPTPAGTLPLVM